MVRGASGACGADARCRVETDEKIETAPVTTRNRYREEDTATAVMHKR